MTRTIVNITLVLILFASESSTATAANSTFQQDKVAIENIIRAQIHAFRDKNAMRAFSFAAPNIQRKFGTAEKFVRMVELGYPAVHNPRSVKFGALTFQYNRAIQKVHLVSQRSTAHLALYQMVKLDTGLWRIEGVTLIRGKEQQI